QDTSPPQSFTITVVGPRDVAIVLASGDSDPRPVTNAVGKVSLSGEQSLTWRILQRTELSLPVLSLHKLVIWYQPGIQQITQEEVSVFQNVYSNGIPFIFVGPNLVSSGAGLASEWQQAWEALLHLLPGGIPGTSGTVVPAQSTSGTLLPNGAYGIITPFSFATPVDEALALPDADSDGM